MIVLRRRQRYLKRRTKRFPADAPAGSRGHYERDELAALNWAIDSLSIQFPELANVGVTEQQQEHSS